MELAFDISQDELPVFLAETDEHLQALDEALVRLERSDNDPELLQATFRSAHTLKGMAGMINHKRMVDLTHVMETAFDGVRKHSLAINTPLIDLCLIAVDGLRLLRDEVTKGQVQDVDVDDIVGKFSTLIQSGRIDTLLTNLSPSGPKPAATVAGQENDSSKAMENGQTYMISAEISTNSIASAARAFQLMMALQELGEIIAMDPSQEIIETAVPVHKFNARLRSAQPIDEIRKSLGYISDVDQLSVQDQNIKEPAPGAAVLNSVPQLGEYLLKEGYISESQLQKALQLQAQNHQPPTLLGNILVQTNAITQENLDMGINKFVQSQKTNQMQAAPVDKSKERVTEKTVRTSVERLDNLMNLVGELITDRNRLYQIRTQLETNYKGNDHFNNMGETVAHLGRITDQLQEEVMRIRMLPISNVFNKFPRLVRDLAQKTGKEIELIIQGEDTELDRSVIDEINDPLIHLVRNSVDHGIEPPDERVANGKPRRGTITLTARHEQGHIIILVQDDGRGINADKLKANAVQKGLISENEAVTLSDEKAIDLIFVSGLSTAQKVTDISGRGVGMDIVRNNIQRINGSILVDTKVNRGTNFQVILPLTLAIVPTLLVRVNEITFAIPLVMVLETLRLTEKDIQTIRGNPVTRLRNNVLPLMVLSQIFDLPNHKNGRKHSYVVVCQSGKMQIGLVVDALMGEEEVVVKSFSALIGDIPGISSAAILGDGQVTLIIDVPGLFKFSGIH